MCQLSSTWLRIKSARTFALARQVCRFVQALRRQELYKLPGVAETLDWASALVALGGTSLNEELVVDTLGTLLKYQDDFEMVRKGYAQELLLQAKQQTMERMLADSPFS